MGLYLRLSYWDIFCLKYTKEGLIKTCISIYVFITNFTFISHPKNYDFWKLEKDCVEKIYNEFAFLKMVFVI